MLPEIDEKQITWEDMEVKEEVEPFGPSPAYMTAATLEQMRQQSKKQNLMCEYHGTFEHEWPDEAECGVDMASEDGDITGILIISDASIEEFDSAVMEWSRDSIAHAFGIPKSVLKSDNQFNWANFMELFLSDALCSPSRNQITGGKNDQADV